MAEINDIFNIGSIVSCKTCFHEELQGEVLAYEPLINTIVLKTPSTSGKISSFDILFVNLHFSSQVKVIKEASGSPPALPNLNLPKLNNRLKQSVDKKSKLLQAIQSGGTVEGQRLFNAIGKTIEDISWLGPNILIMNQVVITPPYTLNNVTEYEQAKERNSRAVTHVRKIVEKFHKDQITSMNNGAPNNNSAHMNQVGPAGTMAPPHSANNAFVKAASPH